VEDVEHFAGVELGTAADPVAAAGLGGSSEIVLCGIGDLVLATLRVGEAEVGHVETRVDEVAGLFGVGENRAVDDDGGGAVAGVLGEVGDFEPEEIVVRKLVGEALLDGDSLGVAGVVAQEERESGAGFDGGDDAVGRGFAEEVESLFLVAAYACNADEHTNETRKAGDGELLDADGHLSVGVVGVDAEGSFAVVARGQALTGGGDVAMVGQGDEGGVQPSCVTAGKEGIGVVGVGFDLPVGEGDGRVGEGVDAVANRLRDGDVALGGEEGVVGVVGGVEEVLAVELAEDEGEENVADGDGALRVGALDGFEAGESAFVVEVVEVIEGLADRRGEVDGIGVGCGVVWLRASRRPKQEGKEESRDYFCAVFYCCSPEREDVFVRSISTSGCGSTVYHIGPLDWTYVTVDYTLGHRRSRSIA
jgi:hypothetical protein